MKKSIFTIAACSFIASAILISCSSPAEKVENAKNNVQEANADLNEANEEYLKDIENCRKETAERIAANDQCIADFNTRMEKEKKEVKEDYKTQMAALERKNGDMKKKMNDYKAEGKEKWESFKTEFSHDMDELGAAFKDLTVKNVR